MAKSKKKNQTPKPRRSKLTDRPPQTTPSPSPIDGNRTDAAAPGWNPVLRTLASIVIVGYLLVLLLGPLSNPIASKHLTGPLAKLVAPIHRGLYMGHGYRFFAPDPGPSHIVKYKIFRQDQPPLEGQFPDRDTIWPRLLYHRWFMLSETIYNEHSQTLTPESLRRTNEETKARVEQLRQGRRFLLADEVEQERVTNQRRQQQSIVRTNALVRTIGKFLLDRYAGDEIELSVVTREIPFPVEVRQGSELNDEVFLRREPNAVIGRFTKSDFEKSADRQSSSTIDDRRESVAPPVDQNLEVIQ